MTNKEMLISIAIMSLVTIAIRFLPFIIFTDRKTPEWISKLEKTLPFAVIGMLVVYCLKDVTFNDVSGFLPSLLALAAVAFSYIRKKNTLLSIILGTVVYMLLIQFVFV